MSVLMDIIMWCLLAALTVAAALLLVGSVIAAGLLIRWLWINRHDLDDFHWFI